MRARDLPALQRLWLHEVEHFAHPEHDILTDGDNELTDEVDGTHFDQPFDIGGSQRPEATL